MYILLAGDIATNPGPACSSTYNCPVQNTALRCLSFNARSLKSVNKHEDGSTTSNLSIFQDLVYSQNFDIITVTETRLNDTISNKEILPCGYNIVRRDRMTEKRGGGVLMALREGLQYDTITPKDQPNLEIVAVELKTKNTECLLSVCYRPPNVNIKEWLKSFTSFLTCWEQYDKVLITGDFNFPDLTWNSDDIQDITPSPFAIEFRELIYDFFLQQVKVFQTRLNNILDLILTNSPECVIDLSCISPTSVDMFSDHNLLLFNFHVHPKLSPRTSRSVFDYHQADWENLRKDLNIGLSSMNISPENANCDPSAVGDINMFWRRWRDKLMDAAVQHIPTKVVKRRNTPPWLDSETCHLFKNKETARRKAKRASKPNHLEHFRNLTWYQFQRKDY